MMEITPAAWLNRDWALYRIRNMQYGLSDRTLQILTALFEKYRGIREVILYGSRAMGTYRNGSDIDITLRTDDSFAFTDLLHLMGDFDESSLPYTADISIYQDIQNPDLKARIDRVGKVLYRAAPPGV
jgi:predicted nucleotidyltransferase